MKNLMRFLIEKPRLIHAIEYFFEIKKQNTMI